MKVIDFKSENVLFIREKDIKRYFIELNEQLAEMGSELKTLRTFKAKSLTRFEKKTNFEPIVQVAKEKYVPLSCLHENFYNRR
jgi:hypothetical protein